MSDPDLAAELEAARRRIAQLEAELGDTAYRDMLATLLASVPVYIYFKDAQRRFVVASNQFCKLFGRSLQEIVGRTDEELFPPEIAAETSQDDLQVIRTGTPILGKEEGGDAVGWVLTTKVPWRDREGHIIGLCGISRDITERKRAEARRVEEQKMQSLGALARGIAHDFNNLLQGLFSALNLALLEADQGSPVQEHLRLARTSAQHAADLVAQILAYSGTGTRTVEAVDLNRLVEDMASLLRTSLSPETTLALELTPGLRPLRGDPSQLRQVVMNLITNAAQALHAGGGRIELKTWGSDAREPSAARVHLRVSDSGPGVPDEIREHIFDPYFTTRPRGTGLGLAVVRGIVRAHGGEIELERPERGTAFRLAFPVYGESDPDQRIR